MTGKERLLAAIKGEDVDRPPIWLREGFNIGGELLDEPMQDPLGAKELVNMEFYLGWKYEQRYRELFDYVNSAAAVMRSWSIGGYINRFLMIPPEYIERNFVRKDNDTFLVEGTIRTPRGNLSFKDEIKRGYNTFWHIEHAVKTIEDLEMLADVPFSFDESVLPPFIKAFEEKKHNLGDRGLFRIEYPTPIVAISNCMDFETFLIQSATHRSLYHELIGKITERLLVITDALFRDRNLDTILNLGGSEQCTPPMMAPEAFEEFVTPYDGQIVRRLQDYDIPVLMHCHGKVSAALPEMIKMGVDASEPVEPPPAGDVTIEEAREIAGDDLTIMGNLEWDELEYSESDHIRKRVKGILATGKKRLILCASAGPLSSVSDRLAANYRAWIDTVMEYSD